MFKNRRLEMTDLLSDVGISSGATVQCLKSAKPPPSSECAYQHWAIGCPCRGRCTFLNRPGEEKYNSCCIAVCSQHPPRASPNGLYPCQACWNRHSVPVPGVREDGRCS